MKKALLCALALGLTVCMSGCANEFIATNQLIADANATKLAAYGDAMAACGTNAACQVGVSMAFATGAGEQKYIQPERTAEILGAYVPFASLGLQAFDLFYGGGVAGTGNAGYVITGDNNTLSGAFGSNLEASGGSTVTAPFSSSNSFTWDSSRDYSIGGTAGEIDGDGVTDTYVDEGVTVTDE